MDPAREAAAQVSRQGQLFTVLLTGAFLITFLPLPTRLIGLFFGAAALVVGIKTLIDVAAIRRRGLDLQMRNQWTLAIGVGLTTFLVLRLAGEAVLYPVVSKLERCIDEANTRVARHVCDQQSEEQQRKILDRLKDAGQSS